MMELSRNDDEFSRPHPGIDSVADKNVDAAKKKPQRKKSANQTAEDWLRLYRLLFQENIFPPLSDTTVERQKQTEKALRQIVSTYPFFAPVDNKIVFLHDAGSISVESQRIQFGPNPAKKDTAPTFTMEAALTMARLASQNEIMLSRGIKLSGSEDEQLKLRAAIDIVNAELPQGMKLVIRSDKQAPYSKTQQAPEPTPQPVTTPRPEPENKPEEQQPKPQQKSATGNDFAEEVEAVKDDAAKQDAEKPADPEPVSEQEGQAVEQAAGPKSSETSAEEKPKTKRAGKKRSQGKPAEDKDGAVAEASPDQAQESVLPADVEQQGAKETPNEVAPARKGFSRVFRGIVARLTKPKEGLPSNQSAEAVVTSQSSDTKTAMTRRRFFTAGYGGKDLTPANDSGVNEAPETVAETVVGEKAAPVKPKLGATRRWLVFSFTAAAASLIAEPALGAGFWEALGFKRSKTYERSKAGSGLYNADGSKKDMGAHKKKNRKQGEEKSQKLKQEKGETRREKAERLKKEKEQAASQKPETRREKARREKAEKKEAERQRKLQQEGKGQKLAHGKVRIVCTHTGESAVLDFNNPHSCKKAFDRVTKDWREGVTYDMAPGLMNLLGGVTRDLRGRGHKVPVVYIVAGFRTEKTNNMLIENSKKRNKGKSGVAKNSFHKKGMALDFYVAGVSLAKVRNAAKRAGAWAYATDQFVHMDTRGAYDLRVG